MGQTNYVMLNTFMLDSSSSETKSTKVKSGKEVLPRIKIKDKSENKSTTK